MSNIRTITLSLFCLLAALCATTGMGCKGDKKKYTVDYLIRNELFGVDDTTPAEQAKMAFDERDPDIRRTAIEKLSQNSWALREPYLKRFAQLSRPVEEEDPSVRAVAVRTLGRAGDKGYLPDIIAALDDPEPMVRWDACVVLNRMPDERAVIRLRQMAIDPEETIDVRAAAATALQHYRQDEVYRTLLRSLNDPDFTVRSAAHDSLVVMTGRDLGYDPMNWSEDRDAVGQETLPEPQVRYRKRPWWDWMKVTSETEAAEPAESRDAADDWDRPWWDWGGVTKPDDAPPGEPNEANEASLQDEPPAPPVGE
jgi:hypothetical protein